MKAAFIKTPGPAENILFGDLPKPKITPTQVLVRVLAVSVNPIDTYVRSGKVPGQLPSPFILGSDLAGVVEAVGDAVTRYQPGDRVWGSNQGMMGRQGTFAEFAAVDECWLYPTPEEISDQDAAAIALVGITAHLALFREAQLKVGEQLMVNGGAGGVGSCAIQMAKAIGARVIATAGSREKLTACRQLGAAAVVHYNAEDFDAVIDNFGAIDVWLNTSHEHDLERAIRHMALRGRVLIMAGRDSRPPLPVGPFYTKDCRMLGFAMFNAPPDEQRKCAAEINRWLARGKLRPRVAQVMKLSEAVEAHRLQEDNTLRNAGTLSGKIVLVP
jgi:NADPH2:quinone reductase